MENKEFNEIKTFKSFRNALVNAMKFELLNSQMNKESKRKLVNLQIVLKEKVWEIS